MRTGTPLWMRFIGSFVSSGHAARSLRRPDQPTFVRVAAEVTRGYRHLAATEHRKYTQHDNLARAFLFMTATVTSVVCGLLGVAISGAQAHPTEPLSLGILAFLTAGSTCLMQVYRCHRMLAARHELALYTLHVQMVQLRIAVFLDDYDQFCKVAVRLEDFKPVDTKKTWRVGDLLRGR